MTATSDAVQGERLQSRSRASAGSLFLSVMAIAGALLMVALFFVLQPESAPASGVQGGADAAGTETAPEPASGPRAASVLSLRVGPSEDYPVVGLVPEGAPMEVLGQSEDGAWLAVAAAPGARFYVWVPVEGVRDGPAAETLEVLPPAPLTED